MLFGAYLVFAVGVAAALDNTRGGSVVRRHGGLVRSVTMALAALLAASATLRVNQVGDDPLLTWAADRPAFLLPGAVGVGALVYLAGGAIPSRAGLVARWVGWLLIVAPMLVPSTLSLSLPLAAALALTLREVSPRKIEPDRTS